MDSAGSKTLAWSVTDYGMTHIAIQGICRRKERRLDGKG